MGRNKRREKDTHPEFSGRANVDGQTYWISGWVKEIDGEKFFSLSFKPGRGTCRQRGHCQDEDRFMKQHF
jgi:hypothetical protein